MKELYVLIRNKVLKVRRRIILKNIISNIFLFTSCGAMLATLLVLISRFIPIYKSYEKGIVLICLSIIPAIIFTLIKAPSERAAALVLDSFGLKERVYTSLYLNEENSFYNLVLKDTWENIKDFQYKNHISLKPNKKFIIALVTLTFIFGVSYYIPNPKEERAKELHALKNEKKEKEKVVKKAEDEIKKNTKLEKQEKEDMLKKIEELKQDIKTAKSINELNKNVEIAMKKLEDRKDINDLNKLAEKLKESDNLKQLGEAVKKKNEEEIKKAVDELKKQFDAIPKDVKEQMKQAIKEGAKNLEDKNLANEISNAADELLGDSDGMSKALDKMTGELINAINSSGAKEVQSLAEALGSDTSNSDNENASNEEHTPNDGCKPGEGWKSSNGSGAANGNGNGQGNGSGSGDGNGNGKGNGKGSGKGSGSGASIGKGQNREKEKIFTGDRLGGSSDKSKLKGKVNKNGKGEVGKDDKPSTDVGDMVPYDEVVGEYEDKAMESINNYNIPEGMRDLVKNYFSSLGD